MEKIVFGVLLADGLDLGSVDLGPGFCVHQVEQDCDAFALAGFFEEDSLEALHGTVGYFDRIASCDRVGLEDENAVFFAGPVFELLDGCIADDSRLVAVADDSDDVLAVAHSSVAGRGIKTAKQVALKERFGNNAFDASYGFLALKAREVVLQLKFFLQVAFDEQFFARFGVYAEPIHAGPPFPRHSEPDLENRRKRSTEACRAELSFWHIV